MKFSIITCTYNSEKYILNNINSVKKQTFRDFEHIFIDGFSTDGTVEIIKKYQQEFPEKVKFFQYPAKGIANAMNKGIERATGEYINHMHSDDNFYENKILQKVASFIEKKNNPNWIYGKALFKNEKDGQSRVIPHRKIYRKVRLWILLLTNFIPHQSVFIKKEIFNKFGCFKEHYNNFMDYDLWIRFKKQGAEAEFINEIICNFSVRDDSQSGIGRKTNEFLPILEEHFKNRWKIRFFFLINKLGQKRNFFK